MAYSQERKEAVLKKMLPPNNLAIGELAKQEGIATWRSASVLSSQLSPVG